MESSVDYLLPSVEFQFAEALEEPQLVDMSFAESPFEESST